MTCRNCGKCSRGCSSATCGLIGEAMLLEGTAFSNEQWEGPGRVYICSICGNMFSGYGNNPDPFPGEECCDRCNREAVITARILQWRFGRRLTSDELNMVLHTIDKGVKE